MTQRMTKLYRPSSMPGTCRPAFRLGAVEAYRPAPGDLPRRPADLLDLSANEGQPLDLGCVLDELQREASFLRRYPDASRLEQRLAARVGVSPDCVIVTAGADDALCRLAMSTLEPGRSAITTTPTFEMIPRYIGLAGACERAVRWFGGPFPLEKVLRSVDRTVSAVFVVSPNNPTGSVISLDELRAIRAGTPGALLIVDLAYSEFAHEDVTAAALGLERTVVTRTFSKAWGLAGLRVGYAIGEPEVIGWLRRAGNPYAVSTLSLTIADRALASFESKMLASVMRVQSERVRLAAFLQAQCIDALPSEANFVLARFRTAARADGVFQRLLARKILVRGFPVRSGIADSLRITCPGDEPSFERLLEALAAAIDETGDSQ